MPASALMNVMTAAARKAGRGLARDFGAVEQLQVSLKGPANFVSAADLRAEETLYDELARARPGYGFLMEERGLVEGTDKSHRWIIDPLDGTTNYLHGFPQFSVSIALRHRGQLESAVVYDPMREEMYTADRGGGAFLNDAAISVSRVARLSDAQISYNDLRTFAHHGRGQGAERLASTAWRVRGFGDFWSHVMVAEGAVDIAAEPQVNPWDLAPLQVIVEEAGGRFTDLDGVRGYSGGSALSTNGLLHDEVLGLFKA